MIHLPDAITNETFETIVSKWLISVKKNDLTLVMSYPSSDRQRRYLNLISNAKIQRTYFGSEAIWITLDLRTDPIDEPKDIEAIAIQKLSEYLLPKDKANASSFTQMVKRVETYTKRKVILSVFGCEKLIESNNTSILIYFTKIIREEVCRLLTFFECNMFSEKTYELLGKVPSFQPRIHTLHVYDEKDSSQFIEYLCAKWDMDIPNEKKKQLIKLSGGMFKIIKESMWILRDNPELSIQSILSTDQMQLCLQTLWYGFGKLEQETIDMLIKKTLPTDEAHTQSFQYLIKTGLIESKHTTYFLSIPALETFRKKTLFSTMLLELDQNTLLLHGVPIDAHFSKSQRRMLRFSLKHPNELINRETLSSLIWEEEATAKYSDWAIDSHISRLRKRVQSLGIPMETIETIKGKGIIWRQYAK